MISSSVNAFLTASSFLRSLAVWANRSDGRLTMRGVTKNITFPMKLQVTDDGVTGASEFAINRHDWNIAYQGAPDDLVQDKVVLTVKFVALVPVPSAVVIWI